MIDFSYTDEQELLLESIREFCQRNMPDEIVKQWHLNGCQPDEVNKLFIDSFGLLRVPEEYGGVPIDTVTMCLLIKELGKNGGLTAIMGLLALYDILEFGSDEQKKFFLELNNEKGSPKTALAISEPGAGSDNMGMTTTAKSVNGKFVINGQKTFSSNARNCDFLLVAAKDEDPSRENTSASLWLVPVKTPGLNLVNVDELCSRTEPFSDVYFDDVVVEESARLGKRGEGFMELMKNFELERIICCASAWAAAELALEEAAAYASERYAFGQAIGKFQLIQKKLVDMQVRLDNIRNTVLETAWKFDHGMDVRIECATAKYYCMRASHDVCDDAMGIFGGIGYTLDSKVGRAWVGSRGGCIAGGTEEIMIHIAGRQILKKYARK